MSKYFWWLAVVLTCVLIFSFSAENADDSTETSVGLARKIIEILPFTSDLPEAEKSDLAQEMDGVIRKAAHFVIYAALGFFMLGAVRRTLKRQTLLIAFVACVLFACSDEFHQLFVNGRSGQLSDVMLDSCGSAAGMLGYIILAKISEIFLNAKHS